jgi:predicted ATPase
MDGKRFIKSLSLKNFLSYGAEGMTIELEPLNVLIGANASGKSNFISAIELLRATAGPMFAPVYSSGGIGEWIYKGGANSPTAFFAAEINHPDIEHPIRHAVSFGSTQQQGRIVDEVIEPALKDEGLNVPAFYYKNQGGSPVLAARTTDEVAVAIEEAEKATDAQERFGLRLHAGRLKEAGRDKTWTERPLKQPLKPDFSILTQRNDPDSYPELAFLAEQYQQIRIYKSFDLESMNSLRVAQRPDLPSDFLEENGRNLSMVINDLEHRGAKQVIVEKMKAVYDQIEDITVKISGNTVQTFIRESGLRSSVPASRLSDGTLRYLCLLLILCHPSSPSLICIEEPEIGMHPDIIPEIAELLVEASKRTQLIVTTHSEMLVSALNSVPESVMICERDGAGSTLRRLAAQSMKVWLEKYTLGDLWLKGELGGTRW